MLVSELDFITVGTGKDCRDNMEPDPELGRSEDDPWLSLKIWGGIITESCSPSLSNNIIS